MTAFTVQDVVISWMRNYVLVEKTVAISSMTYIIIMRRYLPAIHLQTTPSYDKIYIHLKKKQNAYLYTVLP